MTCSPENTMTGGDWFSSSDCSGAPAVNFSEAMTTCFENDCNEDDGGEEEHCAEDLSSQNHQQIACDGATLMYREYDPSDDQCAGPVLFNVTMAQVQASNMICSEMEEGGVVTFFKMTCVDGVPMYNTYSDSDCSTATRTTSMAERNSCYKDCKPGARPACEEGERFREMACNGATPMYLEYASSDVQCAGPSVYNATLAMVSPDSVACTEAQGQPGTYLLMTCANGDVVQHFYSDSACTGTPVGAQTLSNQCAGFCPHDDSSPPPDDSSPPPEACRDAPYQQAACVGGAPQYRTYAPDDHACTGPRSLDVPFHQVSPTQTQCSPSQGSEELEYERLSCASGGLTIDIFSDAECSTQTYTYSLAESHSCFKDCCIQANFQQISCDGDALVYREYSSYDSQCGTDPIVEEAMANVHPANVQCQPVPEGGGAHQRMACVESVPTQQTFSDSSCTSMVEAVSMGDSMRCYKDCLPPPPPPSHTPPACVTTSFHQMYCEDGAVMLGTFEAADDQCVGATVQSAPLATVYPAWAACTQSGEGTFQMATCASGVPAFTGYSTSDCTGAPIYSYPPATTSQSHTCFGSCFSGNPLWHPSGDLFDATGNVSTCASSCPSISTAFMASNLGTYSPQYLLPICSFAHDARADGCLDRCSEDQSKSVLEELFAICLVDISPSAVARLQFLTTWPDLDLVVAQTDEWQNNFTNSLATAQNVSTSAIEIVSVISGSVIVNTSISFATVEAATMFESSASPTNLFTPAFTAANGVPSLSMLSTVSPATASPTALSPTAAPTAAGQTISPSASPTNGPNITAPFQMTQNAAAGHTYMLLSLSTCASWIVFNVFGTTFW